MARQHRILNKKGRLTVHPKGFGFVICDDDSDDLFVPREAMGAALDGDIVSVVVVKKRRRGDEGKIKSVVTRKRQKISGVLSRENKDWIVIPSDPKIAALYPMIHARQSKKNKVGMAVIATIVTYPNSDRGLFMEVCVDRVIGISDCIETDIGMLLSENDVDSNFDTKIFSEAKSYDAVPSLAVNRSERKDLRDKSFITIDPDDARDHDDAICIENVNDGYRVSIAIADVSHYVQESSVIDIEAYRRSFSIYLPDRVISMLPEHLSNDLCSLKPNVDRYAMVVSFFVDQQGVISDSEFCAAIIRSQARLSYQGLASVLRGHPLSSEYESWCDYLLLVAKVGMLLSKQRKNSLNFFMEEPQVILDKNDSSIISDVVKKKQTNEERRSYKIVEAYMVTANELVGTFFIENKMLSLWRHHPSPSNEQLKRIEGILLYSDTTVEENSLQQKGVISELIDQMQNKPNASLISSMILRCLPSAEYSGLFNGHFGLNASSYLHFTSPIRRYPDIVIHRLLKQKLYEMGTYCGVTKTTESISQERINEIGTNCSTQEKHVVALERKILGLYRAYLMRQHKGACFFGKIVSVTTFGVFVEIESPFVEGLVKTKDLFGDESFCFEPDLFRIKGEKSGKCFAIGDKISVKVSSVSTQKQQIDFILTTD